jgi:hypothetical protein
MNTNEITEKTIIKTETQVINAFNIRHVTVVLNERATITVELIYRDNSSEYVNERLINVININVQGDDYSSWGSDDTYIIDYIKNYITNM